MSDEKNSQSMDDITKRLESTLRMAREAEQIGKTTSSELAVQKEQLLKMKDNVKDTKSIVDRSDKITNKMERSWFDIRRWFNK